MGKAEYKVKNGKMIKIDITLKNDLIDKISIMGDFFLTPEELIDDIELALKGIHFNKEEITKRIKQIIRNNNGTLLGANPEDFAKCILMAG